MDWNTLLQDLLTEALQYLPRLIFALVIFFITLLIAKPLGRWVERAARPKIRDPETLRLLGRLTHWSALIIGTIVALDQVNFDVTGFVAALGIAGFTIGFALQDIARNFVAGILLLVRQPFNIGDAIKVGEYTGKVVNITTRDTVMNTWDGEMVIIPNLDIFTTAITNYSEYPDRRRSIYIGLGYEEDVNRAVKLFLGAMRAVDGVLDEPTPTVQAEELGDSTINLVARFWVNQRTHSLLDTHSAVVQALKEVSERESISLPYPIQTVRLERM